MKHLAYDSVFKVYFWEVYDIANTCHLFREKLIKCWSFCVLSYLFLSTYSTIKLNYEYEVILKKQAHHVFRGNTCDRNRYISSEHRTLADFSSHVPVSIWILATQVDRN